MAVLALIGVLVVAGVLALFSRTVFVPAPRRGRPRHQRRRGVRR
ncbi:MAG TPA: hypothetical protein VKR22_06335 [Acidimicrobiales bacterium]|nr:hypothetical protein [Acidimicrobiales bacterium]